MTIPADCAVVTMKGAEYVVAPLNFDQLEALAPSFDLVTSPVDTGMNFQGAATNRAALSKIIHAALTEHQPDITLGQVRELLTLKTSGPIFDAVLQVSGLKSQGEAQAGSLSPA